MKKRMLLVFLVGVQLLACASSQDFEVLPGYAPVIHDSYAPKYIRPGATWRIYLHAEDYEGDMKEIVTFVTQSGVAPFPRNIIKLKEKDSKEVAGYLYLSSDSDVGLLGDRLNVKLVVRDRRDNTSQPLEFSVRFESRSHQEIPEKWHGPANRSLGVIIHEVISPSQTRPTRGSGI